MTETGTLARRQFLRATLLTGVGLTGLASSFTRAAASTTTQAWVLNPSWGFPKGLHGRLSASCHACYTHAANKVFATRSAVEAGRAHGACLCEPESFDLRTTTYDALFTIPGIVEVDRRDPRVSGLPEPPMDTWVDAFAPTRGQVGDPVVLIGRHLTGARGVAFNGARAVFTLDSDHQISTTVPPGATAGVISVQMPDGDVLASGAFVVQHARSVSLQLGEKSTRGRVSVLDGFTGGREGVSVIVQRLEHGRWTDVAGQRTHLGGHYRLRRMSVPGKYRAVVKRKRLPSGDLCMRAVSSEVTR